MRHSIIITLIVSSLLAQSMSFASERPAIAIIVANDHPVKTISLPELKLIYWRKKTYWANGKRIHPINLPSDNPLRLIFSNRVLGSNPSAQHDYWNGLYFHGTSPPHVIHSDEAAIRYVQETAGSIGYTDACKIDARVKPIYWITSEGDFTSDAPDLDCN